MTKQWEAYEGAARKVIEDLRAVFGVATVEGKQALKGASGTSWELDAKAVLDKSGFVVIEVRRHTTSRLAQEDIAAIAFRIEDVGGSGGIVVTPLPLQKGASLVAAHTNIRHLLLTLDSTTESYLAKFLGKVFHGASIQESVCVTDSCDAVIVRGKQ